VEDRHAVVQRALPYLARQTNSWIEQKKCTSCHQVPHALWAMNEARTGGFAVDDRLASWNRWSTEFVLNEAEKAGEDEARADELYQMILNGSTADVESDAARDDGSATVRDKLLSSLRLARNDHGYWPARGQLPDQKRPKQETDEVTTMWSLLTLRSMRPDDDKQDIAIKHAQPKIEARSTSTEHLILRYILALGDGERDRAASLQNEILSHQNEDGGWGWLLEGSSDAMATGQALYALSRMENVHRHHAVDRAHRFLVRTQQPDGSWHVPSTLAEKNDQSYVVSNDWGTAWAVIGLTRTMD
jgi:squalene-hopene/tetraprenyl-beta-curcumene cyclase